MSDPRCAKCGHPRSNHPYRHPFIGPSKDDRIEELEAKLAKAVEALSDLADCVDLGCFCSEMEQATVIDKARAIAAELAGCKHE